MRDNKLQFNRSCHVLYSKACKKQIQSKIALHYPEAQREAVWERVQRQYVEFLSDWRTDLGGKKNFHNGAGGTYDCIAIMSYYAVCRDVVSFREIEEIEENLILPTFRKLSRFVDCNKPFFKRLMYWAFQNAEKQCAKWHDYEMHGHHARPVQCGLCVHGVASRKACPENHLRGRLQVRLYHLRRQRPVLKRPSRIPRCGRVSQKPIRKRRKWP